MNICGIGVDIVEVARIESSIQKLGQAFIDRVFTPAEHAYCHGQRNSGQAYAARFAAKEAVSKSFGTGIGTGLSWTEIEVRRKASGEPFVLLHGEAAALAKRLGIGTVLLSLSHSEHYAVANAIAIGASAE